MSYLKTRNIIIYIFVLSLLISICFSAEKVKKKTFKELLELFGKKLDQNNNSSFSYNQFVSILENLKYKFSDYLEVYSIGKSYLGYNIPIVKFISPKTYKGINQKKFEPIKSVNNTGILFTGMFKGNDSVSMMMNLYSILYLLSLPTRYLQTITSSTNVYFLPVVNIDAYKMNSKPNLDVEKMRVKNLSPYIDPNKVKVGNCSPQDKGVDLSRNFDYNFYNNESSDDPCSQDYRGPEPFSEPETKSIRDFFIKHPEIRMVINYQSLQNSFIIPFSSLSSGESIRKMKEDYPFQYKIYKDFKTEGNKFNLKFGNTDKVFNYLWNGNINDWLLGKRNIFSITHDLGLESLQPKAIVSSSMLMKEILQKNLYSSLYALQKSMYYLKAEFISATYYECDKSPLKSVNKKYLTNKFIKQLGKCSKNQVALTIKIKITNEGLGDYIPKYYSEKTKKFKNEIKTQIKHENKNKRALNYFKFLFFRNKTKTRSIIKNLPYYFNADGIFNMDLNLTKMKSFCYWTTIRTYDSISSVPEQLDFLEYKIIRGNRTEYINSIRCYKRNQKIYKEPENIIIDSKIKSNRSVILNVQIILKNRKFLDTLENLQVSGLVNQNFEMSGYEILKLYRSHNRKFFSHTEIENEHVEWKFNSPLLSISMNMFKQSGQLYDYELIATYDYFRIIFTCLGILFGFAFALFIFIILFRKFLENFRFYRNYHRLSKNRMFIEIDEDNNVVKGIKDSEK